MWEELQRSPPYIIKGSSPIQPSLCYFCGLPHNPRTESNPLIWEQQTLPGNLLLDGFGLWCWPVVVGRFLRGRVCRWFVIFYNVFLRGTGRGETSMKWLHFDEDHVRTEIASLSHIPNWEHAEMPRQPDDTVPRRPRKWRWKVGRSSQVPVGSSKQAPLTGKVRQQTRNSRAVGESLFPECHIYQILSLLYK